MSGSVDNAFYPGNPALTPRDAVRLMIGDTDDAEYQLRNQEIDYALTVKGSPIAAAAFCARAIAAKYARLVTKNVDGNVNHALSDLFKHYTELAEDLDRQAVLSGGGGGSPGSGGSAGPVYAGGISVSDKASREQDTDRVAPAFTVGQFDNEGGF